MNTIGQVTKIGERRPATYPWKDSKSDFIAVLLVARGRASAQMQEFGCSYQT